MRALASYQIQHGGTAQRRNGACARQGSVVHQARRNGATACARTTAPAETRSGATAQRRRPHGAISPDTAQRNGATAQSCFRTFDPPAMRCCVALHACARRCSQKGRPSDLPHQVIAGAARSMKADGLRKGVMPTKNVHVAMLSAGRNRIASKNPTQPLRTPARLSMMEHACFAWPGREEAVQTCPRHTSRRRSYNSMLRCLRSSKMHRLGRGLCGMEDGAQCNGATEQRSGVALLRHGRSGTEQRSAEQRSGVAPLRHGAPARRFGAEQRSTEQRRGAAPLRPKRTEHGARSGASEYGAKQFRGRMFHPQCNIEASADIFASFR